MATDELDDGEVTHISELRSDPNNARRHNPRNIGTIGESLQQVGAARSIVIDEDGVVLAGNGTIEAAAEVGITRVRVVETDGNTLIAVRRRGLSEAQKMKLALFDNRTNELSDFNNAALQDQFRALEAMGEDLHALGWTDAEMAPILDGEFDREPEQSEGRSDLVKVRVTFTPAQWEEMQPAFRIARQNLPARVSDAAVIVWLAQMQTPTPPEAGAIPEEDRYVRDADRTDQ